MVSHLLFPTNDQSESLHGMTGMSACTSYKLYEKYICRQTVDFKDDIEKLPFRKMTVSHEVSKPNETTPIFP